MFPSLFESASGSEGRRLPGGLSVVTVLDGFAHAGVGGKMYSRMYDVGGEQS